MGNAEFTCHRVTNIPSATRVGISRALSSLEIIGRGRSLEIVALNERGRILNQLLAKIIENHPHWATFHNQADRLVGELKPLSGVFPEEERSKQPSAVFHSPDTDSGIPERRRLAARTGGRVRLRPASAVRSHSADACPGANIRHFISFFATTSSSWIAKRRLIERYRYDFSGHDLSTGGLPRENPQAVKVTASDRARVTADHTPEEYMAKVETVREGMRLGNYYEVVLRQLPGPYSSQPIANCSERVQKPARVLTSSCCRWATSNSWGHRLKCLSASKAQRVETCPDCRHGAPFRRPPARCREHPRSA